MHIRARLSEYAVANNRRRPLDECVFGTYRAAAKFSAVLFLVLMVSGCAGQNAAENKPVAAEKIGSSLPADADPALERALRQVSDHPQTQTHESFYEIEKKYRAAPENAAAAAAYAGALRREGLSRRSLLILKPFMQDSAPPLNVVTEYAAARLELGEYQRAESAARKAVALDPSSSHPYHILGVALDAQGMHEEAETALRRALERWEGDSVPVLNNLALALAAQGRIDEALDILKKALHVAPQRRDIERNLRILSLLHENMKRRAGEAAADNPLAGISQGAEPLSDLKISRPPVPPSKPRNL